MSQDVNKNAKHKLKKLEKNILLILDFQYI